MTQNRYTLHSALKAAADVCLLTLVAVMLTACGTDSVFDGSWVADKDGFRMNYSVLNQEETAELVLSEGDQLQVALTHDRGSVDIVIGIDGHEPVYRGTDQANAEFILTIPENGVYRVSVRGHQARGKVSITKMTGDLAGR